MYVCMYVRICMYVCMCMYVYLCMFVFQVAASGIAGLDSADSKGLMGLLLGNLTVFAIHLDASWDLSQV